MKRIDFKKEKIVIGAFGKQKDAKTRFLHARPRAMMPIELFGAIPCKFVWNHARMEVVMTAGDGKNQGRQQ